ncbi:MAG TPA: RNA polymerase sigma factor [Ktedonobacteraceae bacterium]|nr:RNA polymerase sigma factor [Ktedonobacteraceae bacterium]
MYQQMSQAPDHLPLESLYQKHARTILRYIQRYIFSRDDADDILIEVFLAALEDGNVFNLNEGNELPWLLRVAHNKIVDYQRLAVRHPTVAFDELLDSPFEKDELTPELAAMIQEDFDLLRRQLALLPENQQQVLRLRFADGLRTKEIARQLHKSDGAIRALLLRSLNLLRKLYKHEEWSIYE